MSTHLPFKMIHSTARFAVSALALAAPLARAAGWGIIDTYVGPSFLTGFTHEAIADPTHGRVQ